MKIWRLFVIFSFSLVKGNALLLTHLTWDKNMTNCSFSVKYCEVQWRSPLLFSHHANLEMKQFESVCFFFYFFLTKKLPLALEQYNVITWSPQGYKLGCMLFSPSRSREKNAVCCRKIKGETLLILVHWKRTRLINKQQIIAQQTPKTEHRPAVEWQKEEKTAKSPAVESRQRKTLSWSLTYICSKQHRMSTNVWLSRKIWENKKSWKSPLFQTLKQDLGVVDVVKQTHTQSPLHAPSAHLWFLTICMHAFCARLYIYVNVRYIYLHLGLRITCPNRSQGKIFIWRTFTEML